MKSEIRWEFRTANYAEGWGPEGEIFSIHRHVGFCPRVAGESILASGERRGGTRDPLLEVGPNARIAPTMEGAMRWAELSIVRERGGATEETARSLRAALRGSEEHFSDVEGRDWREVERMLWGEFQAGGPGSGPVSLTLAEVQEGAKRAEERVKRWAPWKKAIGDLPELEAEVGRLRARIERLEAQGRGT